jgi:endonuclease/exonuclease/phosphatase family metal-dependent hydrolase
MAPVTTNLRVMTFNVRGANHKDGENVWERRAPLNVAVIRRYAPDLIGFQELQEGNLRLYERELSHYDRELGPKTENRKPHQRNAIFWDPERFEVVERGGFWLSETPERHSASWETRQIRAANWVRLKSVSGGVDLLYVNTHLDHISKLARIEGAKLITARLKDVGAGLPVIITGDFNCNPGSRPYEVFSDAGFSDAHILAGNPRQNTFHRFLGEEFVPRGGRESRIDWVLLRDGAGGAQWRVGVCEVIRDGAPPVYPSDHYPVLVELEIRA